MPALDSYARTPLGFFPTPVLDISASSVTALLESYNHALAAAKSAALASH